MAMLLKGILAIFLLLMIPVAAGCMFLKKEEPFSITEAYVNGYLSVFAMTELLLLPCIFFKRSLSFLFLLFTGCCVLMAVIGIRKLIKKKEALAGLFLIQDFAFSNIRKQLRERVFLIGAILLMGVQFLTGVLWHRPDADDAFYVAAAVTDLYENSVFQVSPYTGALYKHFPTRYVLSPFPDFLAVVSRFCRNLHPAILAHTFFPVFFGLLAYAVQRMISKKLFPGEKKKQDLYLFFIAFLICFSCVSVYNAGTFQMIRLWQGKALIASALLPALVYYSVEVILEKKGSVLFLLMVDIACCLPSSMGVVLSGIVLGTFFLLSLFFRKGFRSCLNCILAALPSVALGMCYFLLS